MGEGMVGVLGEFAAEVSTTGVDSDIRDDVRGRVLDVMGNALAAHGTTPAAEVRAVVTSSGGEPQATSIGWHDRLPATGAALINGTLAHSLDFDDTHLPSVLHPSACVVPAALAVAEAVGASGEEVVRAIAAGDEICVRVGMASYDAQRRSHRLFDRGLHATSICGTLGAAAASALLLGADAPVVAHAIAIAASMGSGIIEANRTGGSVKPVHCGWAAQAGVSAAQFALGGVTGPPTALEGRFGFFQAFSDGEFDGGVVVDQLGERWELRRIFYKPYPTNHFTHAGIDAALTLREGLDLAEIETIELGVAAPTLRTIAEPVERKARPDSPHSARFSGPFTIAAALCGGGGLGVGLDDFTEETIRDPQRLHLASLVRCVADEQASEAFPHQFSGVLRIGLRDGSILEHRVRHTRGGPEWPLSEDELQAKFMTNATRVFDPDRALSLREIIGRLEELEDLGALFPSAH
jgi:2-methylcitrate dehydratase PrpD